MPHDRPEEVDWRGLEKLLAVSEKMLAATTNNPLVLHYGDLPGVRACPYVVYLRPRGKTIRQLHNWDICQKRCVLFSYLGNGVTGCLINAHPRCPSAEQMLALVQFVAEMREALSHKPKS